MSTKQILERHPIRVGVAVLLFSAIVTLLLVSIETMPKGSDPKASKSPLPRDKNTRPNRFKRRSAVEVSEERNRDTAREKKESGGVSVAREHKYTGILFGSKGLPVSNALVSLNEARIHFLSDALGHGFGTSEAGSSGVQLQEHEDRTDAGGRFELEAPFYHVAGTRPKEVRIGIWTADGTMQVSTAPLVEKRESVEDIVLRLLEEERIWIEFRNQDGCPIARDELLSRLKSIPLLTDMVAIWAIDKNRGRAIGFPVGRKGDAAAYSFGMAASSIESLEVYPHETGVWETRVSGLVDGSKVDFVLPPSNALPAHPLHLRILWDEEENAQNTMTKRFAIRACLARPERQTWRSCCGLGARWKGGAISPPLDVDITVRAPRLYWISIRPAYQEQPVRCYGPFLPGPEVHEILLDDVLPFLFVPRKPTSVSCPTGTVEVEVRSALTGEPVAAVLRDVEDLTATTDKERFERQRVIRRLDGEAPLLRMSFPVGNFTARIGAYGFESTPLFSLEIRSESPLRLDSVQLRPKPRFRARLLEANGDPVASKTPVTLWGSDRERLDRIQLEEGGWIRAPASEGIPLRVVVRQQMFAVDNWTPDEPPLKLQLAPRHPTTVRIVGLQPDDAGVRVTLWAQRVGSAGEEICFEGKHSTKCCQVAGRLEELGVTLRRYNFLLPPGIYRITGQSMLYDIDGVDIEVPKDAEVELSAHAAW